MARRRLHVRAEGRRGHHALCHHSTFAVAVEWIEERRKERNNSSSNRCNHQIVPDPCTVYAKLPVVHAAVKLLGAQLNECPGIWAGVNRIQIIS